MALLSDLKHVLENVYNGTNDLITLDKPIPFNNVCTSIYITHVQKIGKSWQIVDNSYNHWTISKLSNVWQMNIKHALLSMKDSREPNVYTKDLTL